MVTRLFWVVAYRNQVKYAHSQVYIILCYIRNFLRMLLTFLNVILNCALTNKT